MASEQEVPNYPDLLGAVTGGPRLNLDVVQGALAVRPFQAPAGQPFEVVFLLQNASDVDVDVVIAPVLPDKDAAGQKERFSLKSSKLRIGLRPAEVGFMTLPVLSSAQTKPARGYTIGLNVEVKRVGKERPQRVRETNGGGRFNIEELSDAVQKQISTLRMLHFSADNGGKKNFARAAFEVHPAASASTAELKPNWVSLWTLRDYMDEYTMAQKVWPVAQKIAKQLTRDKIFMPLLKSIQTNFQACGYPLSSPEALFIAKQLTLILEQGVTAATSVDPRPDWPHWFAKLVKLLYGDEGLANSPVEQIATQLLFNELVYDGIMQGFTMVGTVLNEDFGTPDETGHYAADIVDLLGHTKPLDFARAYLPLILGGLIACGRVVMPGEQLINTIELLSKALANREREKNEDNDFIFDMAHKLIVRAEDSLM